MTPRLLPLLIVACTGPSLCHPRPQQTVPIDEPGKWVQLTPRATEELSDAQRELIAQLEALGYADGTRDAQGASVTLHDPTRAWPGVNLYNSGHDAEALLVDMDGTELHRWHLRWADAFPDKPLDRTANGVNHWRRVLLHHDGSLTAIFEGRGLVRLTRDSQLVWADDRRAHHDLVALPGARLMVLDRQAEVVPAINPEAPVTRDAITILGPSGEVEQRVDLVEALLNSPYAHLLTDSGRTRGDLLHTNSLHRLDHRAAHLHPAFQPGRVLVSFREIDTVAVVDLDTKRVVWAFQGDFHRQHDAELTAAAELMLFDNRGPPTSSRVIRYRLPDMEPTWSWAGTLSNPFRSNALGAQQELPNGNLLISESEGGRALELTPEGEVVWEFYNPHRAGDEGQYIAALFEMVRLPRSAVDWLDAPPPAPSPR